jgi:UDP-glucose 4-epimerase
MRVLLTGAAGSLARDVARALEDAGHEVTGLDVRPRRDPSTPAVFERVKRYDHRRVAEVFRTHRPRALVHLGVRSGGFQAQARQRYTQNVLGTRHLLELARRSALDRVVVLGTYHVYGAHPHNPTFLREDAPLQAVQTFPELLDVVELDHTVTNFLWRHRNVPTVLLRPVNIVGPRLNNQVSTLLRARRCPRLLGYNPMLQFLHAEDLVHAIRAAVESEVWGVFNVAGEGAIPWGRAIRAAGGRPLTLPHPVAYPAVRALSRVGVAFPEHLMDFFRYPVIVSDGVFRERVGWRPRWSLMDTLAALRGA